MAAQSSHTSSVENSPSHEASVAESPSLALSTATTADESSVSIASDAGTPTAFDASPRTASAYGMIRHGHALEYTAGRVSKDKNALPFERFENVFELRCEGQRIMPEIYAQVLRNVFKEDGEWHCYRRNYISLTCSYTFTPMSPRKPLFAQLPGELAQVQALALSLTAAVDKADGKEIELIQFNAKRDINSKLPVAKVKVSPKWMSSANSFLVSDGFLLPLQQDGNTSSPASAQQGSVTFDRIQFKVATQNNGGRRNHQQYYHLLVGLYADVRKSGDVEPHWVKVAHQISERLVVRGRSPSHYEKRRAKNMSQSTAGGSGAPGIASKDVGFTTRSEYEGTMPFSYGPKGGPTGDYYDRNPSGYSDRPFASLSSYTSAARHRSALDVLSEEAEESETTLDFPDFADLAVDTSSFLTQQDSSTASLTPVKAERELNPSSSVQAGRGGHVARQFVPEIESKIARHHDRREYSSDQSESCPPRQPDECSRSPKTAVSRSNQPKPLYSRGQGR